MGNLPEDSHPLRRSLEKTPDRPRLLLGDSSLSLYYIAKDTREWLSPLFHALK